MSCTVFLWNFLTYTVGCLQPAVCPDVDFRPEDRGAPARNERRVHPLQQHHLHQERLRDPGQERAVSLLHRPGAAVQVQWDNSLLKVYFSLPRFGPEVDGVMPTEESVTGVTSLPKPFKVNLSNRLA